MNILWQRSNTYWGWEEHLKISLSQGQPVEDLRFQNSLYSPGVSAALECRIGIFPAKTHPTNEIWACSIPKQLHWNVFLLYFPNHWFNIWQLHFWLKIDPSCALCCSTKASKCRQAFWQVETKHCWFVRALCIFGRISDVDTFFLLNYGWVWNKYVFINLSY